MMLVTMRTTLTVEDELMHLARERAASLHLPLVEVINRALRKGLTEDRPQRVATPTVVYGGVSGSGPDDARLREWQRRLDDEDARRQAGL